MFLKIITTLTSKKSTITLNFGKPIMLSELPDDVRKKSGIYVRDLVVALLDK